ncbi:MAG: peptidoglycan-associated lipoprotein Pal [Acidobacteriota bacterium]
MKNRSMSVSILTLVLATGLVGMPGCKKKPPEEAVQPTPPPVAPAPAPAPAPTPTPPPPAPEPARPARPSLATLNAQLRTIHFDFDKSAIRADASATLQANATLMNRYPDLDILISGHCDERGTIEYNLALGDRRAAAARQALADLGVDVGRVQMISYGEERPIDPGHNERAWSQNRRAEFRFIQR